MPRRLEGKRVAFISPQVVRGNGQGRVNLEVVRRVREEGAAVTILADRIEPDLLAANDVRTITFPGSHLPTHMLRSQSFGIQSGRWLAAHRNELDIIHANGSVTLFPSDVNSAHFVHGAWAKSPAHTSKYHRNAYGVYHGFLTALHARQEKIAYRRSRRVIAVSEQVKRELVAIGIAASKIAVVLNGVDTAEFAPGSYVREQLGLPPGFLALFAGDMSTPRKNLDSVLKALVAVPNVSLAVLGSLAKNPYPDMAAAMGLSERVHFLGFRRDMGLLMRAADVFVFPSRYEACSLVILEALASGLPVITAATAGGSEIVDERSGIVLSDPDDYLALASALAGLAADPARRTGMASAARRVADENTWATMADRYVDNYLEVLAEKAAELERA